eukprot:GEMP01020130.1.p1 GENE.GEMP01020130.1~~GEMP01020130.1.p1  ORF type:complete len:636 (+),score=147.93 GEMP01020130.1:71-1909(+)
MVEPYRCHYCKRGWENWMHVPHWTSSRPKKAYCITCALQYLEIHVVVPPGAPLEPTIPPPNMMPPQMMLRNTPEPVQVQGFPGVEGVPHNPYAIANVAPAPPGKTSALNDLLIRYAAQHGMAGRLVIKLPIEQIEELQREKKQQLRWEDKNWNPPWPCTGLCGTVFLSEHADLCWSKSKPRKPWCSACNTLNTAGPLPPRAYNIPHMPIATTSSMASAAPMMNPSYQPNGAAPSSSSTAMPNPQLAAPTGPPPPVPHGLPHAAAPKTLPCRPAGAHESAIPGSESVPPHIRMRNSPTPAAPPSPPTRAFPTSAPAPPTTLRPSAPPAQPTPLVPPCMPPSDSSPSPPQAFRVLEQQSTSEPSNAPAPPHSLEQRVAPGAPNAQEQCLSQEQIDALQRRLASLQLDAVEPPHAERRLASGPPNARQQPFAPGTVNVEGPPRVEQHLASGPPNALEQRPAFGPPNASGPLNVLEPPRSADQRCGSQLPSASQPPRVSEPPFASQPHTAPQPPSVPVTQAYPGFIHAVPDELSDGHLYREWVARVVSTWTAESDVPSEVAEQDLYMPITEGEQIRIVAQDPIGTNFKHSWLRGLKDADGSTGWFPGDWVERAGQS